jgi:alanine-glyoxylate transaminase/serine-glyoxylate transaminase/serine-pyruvate transaminase
MKENVERVGATAIMVQDVWGHAVDPSKVEAALAAHPDAKLLAFVHAETSTGARSDASTLCALARRAGCLSLMDAVTSVGSIEVDVDGWGADATYAGTQKCLSSTPGISPVTFSERAVEVIKTRKTRVQSWFLDMNLVMGYWDGGSRRAYHHTAPINALYALHEALVILEEEGLAAAWARHALHHQALVTGIEAMGLSLVVAPADRLPQLNSVTIPEGIDEAHVRAQLLAQYGLEIGAGLGSLAGKVWRIGLMGYACNRKNVLLCLGALDAVLTRMHAPVASGVAVGAAMAFYDSPP